MLDVRQHTTPGGAGRPAQQASPPPAAGLDPAQATTAVRAPVSDPLSRLMRSAVEQRTRARRPILQRSPESAKLLKELARPKVLEAPALDAQKTIIDKVEAAIAAWAKSYTGERRFGAFYPDDDQLFLGAIELPRIPASADEDQRLIDACDLVDVGTANSLRRNDFELVHAAGVEREVVTNTLKTMIAAKQIDYLRKSDLPNDEWKIVIEVHYTRKRGKNSPQFHKDTLGQTLFVNLNYAINAPVAGPEYMVNPTPLDEWDAVISGSLPPEFYKDLRQVRDELDDLQLIEASDVPAYGAVAFVDEAIHHRTPILGHRGVRGGAFEKFLQATYGVKRYDEASAAYDEYMSASWPAFTYSADNRRWFKWIEMARKRDAKFTRPDFTATGMSAEEVDALLAVTDRESATVSIPKLKQGAPQDIHPANREGRPALKRQMSQRALARNLPPNPPGERRFFRTWVIAVRR